MDDLYYTGPLDFKRRRNANYQHTLTCKVCGQDFQAARANAKTCSTACRSALYRKRKVSKTDSLQPSATNFLLKLEKIVPDAVRPIWLIKERFGVEAALLAAQALHAVATAQRNAVAATADTSSSNANSKRKKGGLARLLRGKL
jgi:predicted nucleic acid-binding Zn ribbon protein